MNKIIAERYELIDVIGNGGMADVYLAKDTILNRTIAIKILRTSLAKDPVYIARFQREASAAAALSHKNIVEIYDVGEDNNQYYIVMEYVPGQTLKELINKRGALHVVEAIDIMKQVVSGTARAHRIGIIHRDLKPQNILVTDSGTAKITDFGIASIQSLAQVTQTDVIMGSLHYLAPELARGEKATVQSDIYALGIVFYELLRGQVPFNGESPVNIALKHMQEDIPSVRDFNSSIPQSVENIIIKATAKNLKDRYQNINDMLEDLQTCLSRMDEEKLVFVHDEPDPTIVVNPRQIFDHEEEVEEKKEKEIPVKENPLKNIDPKILIGAVVGVIAVIAVVCVLIFGGSDASVMPDIVGLDQNEASKLLEDYNVTINQDMIYKELSDKYDEGLITKSDPKKGSSIKKGDVITITVSKGKYIIIDNYKGMTYEAAKKALEKLDFDVEVEYIVSNEKNGTVIGQSLKKGYKQDPTEDKEITLTVSKGEYVVIENYVGMSFSEAETKLKELGFNVTKREQASEEEAGKVIDQNLASGYKVDPSDENRNITLTVSSGYSQTVPSVIGLSPNSAKTNLTNLGFSVTMIGKQFPENGDNEEYVGRVFRQSIEAGTKVTKKNTEITIYYYED